MLTVQSLVENTDKWYKRNLNLVTVVCGRACRTWMPKIWIETHVDSSRQSVPAFLRGL